MGTTTPKHPHKVRTAFAAVLLASTLPTQAMIARLPASNFSDDRTEQPDAQLIARANRVAGELQHLANLKCDPSFQAASTAENFLISSVGRAVRGAILLPDNDNEAAHNMAKAFEILATRGVAFCPDDRLRNITPNTMPLSPEQRSALQGTYATAAVWMGHHTIALNPVMKGDFASSDLQRVHHLTNAFIAYISAEQDVKTTIARSDRAAEGNSDWKINPYLAFQATSGIDADMLQTNTSAYRPTMPMPPIRTNFLTFGQ